MHDRASTRSLAGEQHMSDLMAARTQMATSLGFHIIFAALGMGLPLLMVIAEGLYLRTGNTTYLALAKRWSKAFAILFAVGAVSGTILSFELGLLWPRFMQYAGGIFGMPFSAEGFAFFIEAIFLGIYLYGWNRLSPRAHWLSGIPVAVAGALSGIFVVAANAWMNSPSGFRIDENGQPYDIDPVAAMFNDAWFQQALHMWIAAYTATAFGVAGVYAWGMLRGRRDTYHLNALKIAVGVGLVVSILQAVSGDNSAKWVAENQPVKFAAMEGLFETESGAGLSIGGWPDPEARETTWAIEIPNALSWLAHGDPNAEVVGLNEFPMDEQPEPRVVHLAFQIMVGIGTTLILASSAIWFFVWRRKRFAPGAWQLRALVVLAPAGFIAIEAGWVVTEVGRQPWIIQGVMRTEDAVTQVPNQFVALGGFTALYALLAVTCTWLLLLLAKSPPRLEEPAPEGDVTHALA
jgi:cytochrome bd ubiquinol oxidase subunit I